MPLIAYGKDVLNKLYTCVSQSVVSVDTHEKVEHTLDFFTGFIVYSESSGSVVCVHNSALAPLKDLYVHFNDGSTEKAHILVREATADIAILRTESSRHCPCPVVTFSLSEVRREDIFTITEVEGGSGFHFLKGTVIAPCCEALADENSKEIVPGSKSIFALSCPAKKQVLGGGVFDMEGWLVGIIILMDDSSYRLKFAMQACKWVDKLEDLLKGLDEKYSLSKKVKSEVTPCEKEKEVGDVAEDNQAIYDEICRSVVEIVCYKSVPPHDLKCSIPGVITNLGDGRCHIIAYNKEDLCSGKFELIFPDKEKMEISEEDLGQRPKGSLVAFYVNRSTTHQMKAVDFSKEDVTRNDEVFTVGFDMNLPSCHISPGHVTHEREESFSHDSSPHLCTSRGDLVFNKYAKLIGISYLDCGVTYALNVKSITKHLSSYYEGMTIDDISIDS